MIPPAPALDQQTLAALRDQDPLVQRYRAFFALLDWSLVPERDYEQPWPGSPPHPKAAYIKALLLKLCQHHLYITQLRSFLLEHPLLVLELGFRPLHDPNQPYGFDVARTLPCARWLRHQQQHLDNALLGALLAGLVAALQRQIPGLGQTVAFDVKHIFAWVEQNNPKAYLTQPHDPQRQPSADPDCRLGAKRSSNQTAPEGQTTHKKQFLWGYGSGVAAVTDPRYGDVVLAEYTQAFNQADVSYYEPLYQKTVAALGYRPTNVTADAAFDAWHVYQSVAVHGGIAAIPLNSRGVALPKRSSSGEPLCAAGLAMIRGADFRHEDGYRARHYRCALLHPRVADGECTHEQYAKGVGCVKRVNIEPGGLQRVLLARDSEAYKSIYRQRTAAERINSQAVSYGIERPKVRNAGSVRNLNTLTYIVINVKALQRARKLNASAQTEPTLLC